MQKKICSIFSSKNLQTIAVRSGFYKRSSKMLPCTFFDILLQGASINGSFSLSQFSGEADLTHDVSISKQALDDRFDDTAVAFVKSVLDEILSNQIEAPFDLHFLDNFKSVKIKDATRFDLPNRLKEYFPGFGGQITSDAGVAIQCEFDLKTRKLFDLDITSALKNDIEDAKEKIGKIERNDLIIRDLGYFSSKVINAIIDKKAFFLSRMRTKMDVFDENQQEVSFKKMYAHMIDAKKKQHHIMATIGSKQRIPVRLLMEIVPEEIYQERIRKREKECKKKGYAITDEFKARAHFTIMITNVPEKDLPVENIYKLYKTRWQIELLFKGWKSVMGIDKIHPMKYHRLMCLLYAKFILFLVNNQVIGLFARRFLSKKQKLLSFDKSLKTLQIYFEKTRQILTINRTRLTKYIHDMDRLLSKNHWLEKRKNKVGFQELFELFTCK
jgi:hypothetical protein